jgi:hypothetical protein
MIYKIVTSSYIKDGIDILIDHRQIVEGDKESGERSDVSPGHSEMSSRGFQAPPRGRSF